MNNQSNILQNTIITPGLRRAKVHSLRRQQIITCLDSSGSMNDANKATDAFEAFLGCVKELALPINKDAFELAVIHFADDAKLIHPIEKVTSLLNHLTPLDPSTFGGYGTNIAAALELTLAILKKAETSQADKGITYTRPICMLMSDGRHNTGTNPVPVATELKQICDILTIAFGSDADENMLREIATEQLNIRCNSGSELRCYFAIIGQTLTATRTTGQAFSSALALYR